MASLFTFFFFFFLLSLSTAFADLQQTRSLLKPTQFSPLLFLSDAQNLTSPTRYFEVNRPPVPNRLTARSPCTHRILHHDFGYTYGKPPVFANYTFPSHCSTREFSKIVLEFNSSSHGRQFDRIFGVWINGIEILRSCTAEPRANGIVWSIEKDVTKYKSILLKNETQILAVYLGNIVDKTYTGVYNVHISFHFYPLERNLLDSSTSVVYTTPQADMILPISRNLPLNDGLWFEIVNSTDSGNKEFKIPRNVYRAVLEVYVSFHENDEFWYGNFPNEYVTANNLSSAGNGPFREVLISLDGDVVGAVWPFPVVFTGGINPLLWRPITAIGSFDLPTYDIEITPFLGSLLDGKAHELEFSVTNALNVWYVDANLHLWLDQKREKVEGKVLEVSKSSLEITLVSEFKGLNGKFTTNATRSITASGLVKSSHGDLVTKASQEFSYGNMMVLGKEGNLQIIDQLIQANDHIHTKIASKEIYSTESIKTFPFYLKSDYLDNQGDNNTSLSTANVSMGFNEVRSESNNGLISFKSKLENKQDAQGVMVVKNNLVVSGHGSTQQVYRYIGSDQCYFRSISSFNYTILYDNLETSCKKTNKPLRVYTTHMKGGRMESNEKETGGAQE